MVAGAGVGLSSPFAQFSTTPAAINLVEYGRVEGAVGGIFKNPNDLALNMVAFLPFAVFIALRPGSMVRRATAGLCAVMMLGAIVASHSRSGTLGLVAMLGVLGLSS